MVLLITGFLLIVMGLFSGTVLVAVPLGLAAWTPNFLLWVFFPVFSIVGLVLFFLGARTTHIRWLTIAVSYLLLLLALVAAGGLVLSAASVIQLAGSTLSLWYVLAVAGILGIIGAAPHGTERSNT